VSDQPADRHRQTSPPAPETFLPAAHIKLDILKYD